MPIFKKGDETNLDINTNEAINDDKFAIVNKLLEMIAKGKITDGFTIAAYTLANLKGFI